LIYKELNGAAGYEYGSLIEHKTLNPFEILKKAGVPNEVVQSAFDQIIDKAMTGVWEQPFSIEDGSIRLDGATWTIEAIKEGKCHVVTRWSPERGSTFRLFAEDIIRLSGRRFYYDEFY
jgi:hypothetical protein